MVTDLGSVGPFGSESEAAQLALSLGVSIADVFEWSHSYWASDRSNPPISALPGKRWQSFYQSGYFLVGSPKLLAPGDRLGSDDGAVILFDLSSPAAFDAADWWGRWTAMETAGPWGVWLVRSDGPIEPDTYISAEARRAESAVVLETLAISEPEPGGRPWSPVDISDALADVKSIARELQDARSPGTLIVAERDSDSPIELPAGQRSEVITALDDIGIWAPTDDEATAWALQLMRTEGESSVTIAEFGGWLWACTTNSFNAQRRASLPFARAVKARHTSTLTRFGYYGTFTDSWEDGSLVLGGDTYTDASDPAGFERAVGQAYVASVGGGVPTVYLVEATGSALPDPPNGFTARTSDSMRVLAKLWSGPSIDTDELRHQAMRWAPV